MKDLKETLRAVFRQTWEKRIDDEGQLNLDYGERHECALQAACQVLRHCSRQEVKQAFLSLPEQIQIKVLRKGMGEALAEEVLAEEDEKAAV